MPNLKALIKEFIEADRAYNRVIRDRHATLPEIDKEWDRRKAAFEELEKVADDNEMDDIEVPPDFPLPWVQDGITLRAENGYFIADDVDDECGEFIVAIINRHYGVKESKPDA